MLRDFLYLDVDRVRSLLAQLEGGVVEQVVERSRSSQEGRAAASVFNVFEVGSSLLKEKAAEQTKSLHDALYLIFEDAARELDLFRCEVDLEDPHAWDSQQVHGSLKEGQLLWLNAPIRVLDSTPFSSARRGSRPVAEARS